MKGDAHDLERFGQAQEPVYRHVVEELRDGHKCSHWMWFVFPQLRGLGSSPTARHYGISGADEARAYAAHPLLGRRLLECTRLVLAVRGRTALEIFGTPDELKFGSSMTLFDHVGAGREPAFAEALERFFAGRRDERTLALLGR